MINRFGLKKFIIIIIALVMTIIYFLSYTGLHNKYSEELISFERLIDSASEIKDFEAKNGEIRSLSNDPWISFSDFSTQNIKSINININYLSDDYTNSEVFVFSENNGLSRYVIKLTQGDNVIRLREKSDSIDFLRFDLLTGANQTIGINNIVINDKNSINEYFEDCKAYVAVKAINIIPYLFFVCFVVMLIYLMVLISNKKFTKKYVYYVSGLGVAFIIYIIFVSTGARGIYHNRNLSFEEFINYGNNLKSFELKDDLIISETNDPWVTYYDDRASGIRTVTLNIDSITYDNIESELFVFYKGEFELIKFNLKKGENNIIIPKNLKGIDYLRFDLVSKRGIEIKVSNLEINKADVLKPVLRNEMFVLFSRLFIWLMFVSLNIFMIIWAKRYENYKFKNNFINKGINKHNIFIALLLFLLSYLSLYIGLFAIFIAAVLGFYIGRYGRIYKRGKPVNKSLCYFAYGITLIIMYALVPETGLNNLFFNMSSIYKIKLFMFLICNFQLANITVLIINNENKENNEKCSYELSTKKTVIWLVDIVCILFMTISIEMLAGTYLYKETLRETFLNVISADNFYLNILLFSLIYYFIRKLFGNIIGFILNIASYLFIFIANFVKLKYHDSVFKPMDALQISDFLSIVTLYVNPIVFYGGIIILIAIIIYLIYRKRKLILSNKPNLWLSALCLFFMVYFGKNIYANEFIDMGIDSNQLWEGTEACVRQQGLICYTYIECIELSKIYPTADENYSENYMKEIREEFDKLYTNEDSDVKPNVILVMEESMFDVTKVPDVKFSIDPTKNLRKYAKADVISPKYGGSTASVEFEALTGMSNYFFLDNVSPYVTYWNNTEKKIPGLAYEFNASGYNTMAIHPNTGKVYNRDIIYECMDFDRFIDSSDLDFSNENLTDDSYFKDSALADVIENELEGAGDEPSFIFAVTIENHTLYKSKYSNPEIKLSSDKISAGELNELEQYTEGDLNADRFIEDMIDIVDNADRPTLLYIWGDHLPALSAFNTLGFIDDKYNKYTTPIVAYSNYKDVEIGEEYITPNQIAPQILRDSGIKHNSYFDFIYSLRDIFPVVHKEFGVDENNEIIKKYENVQYDLLFGEKYLLE